MPVFPQTTQFLQMVRAANPTYSRLKSSSLQPLVAILNSPNGNANQVALAITRIRSTADVLFVNKANKYKSALHFLQRTYPIPLAQWVTFGAQRGRAIRFTQTPMPGVFNPYGPAMYANGNVTRLQPQNQWEGAAAQSVEDFVYTAAGPIGVVLIHLDGYQNGMHERVDGIRVIDHMQNVLVAVRHRGGNACALHIGNTPPVLPALAMEFNAFGVNRVIVNEQGHRHMGSFHAAFNQFVTAYATVVVMGFDADNCVRANLFGTKEYAANAVQGTNSLTPITAQADAVTSRAVLVTGGVINSAEYGLIQNL
ncbi:MAG: hypothetical protein K7J46_10250 [Bryobacter sp.]|nr:hypothetical protein [Bryobacter sp. CoA8 C33]